MTGKSYSIHIRNKKQNSFYYVQFKNSDGTWSTPKSSGVIVNSRDEKKSRKEVEDWAVKEYARICVERIETEKLEALAAEEQIRKSTEIYFSDYATGFFNWNNEWALDKRDRGLRITEKWCMQKQKFTDRYLIPHFKEKLIQDIDKNSVKEFRGYLYHELKLAGGTVNHILDSLNQILTTAKENDLLLTTPIIKKVSRKPKQQTGVLSIEEAKRLFFQTEWDDYMSYVFCLLCALTGSRKGEALALQLKNIHATYIEIEKTWDTELFRLTDCPKNGETRNVILAERLRMELDRLIKINPYGDPDSFVFFSVQRKDRPVDSKVMMKYFYRALEKIDINESQRRQRKIVLHSNRHFANTLYIVKGVKTQNVQATIGHGDDGRMTQHYFHAQIENMKDVKQVQEDFFNNNNYDIKEISIQ